MIYPVAAVWAFIILTIDRALLAGYRPYLSMDPEAVAQFVAPSLRGDPDGHDHRPPAGAAACSATRSPSVIEKDRAAEIEIVRGGFERREDERSAVKSASWRRPSPNSARSGTRLSRQSSSSRKHEDASAAIPGLTAEQQAELKKATDEATKAFRDRLAIVDKQSEELTPHYTKLQTELGFWQAEFERELNGQRSGMKGEGPRARSIRADQLDPRREESKRIGAFSSTSPPRRPLFRPRSREAEKRSPSPASTPTLKEIASGQQSGGRSRGRAEAQGRGGPGRSVRHPAERPARNDQAADRQPSEGTRLRPRTDSPRIVQ
ncbi:MAG: hypothetical protein QM755_10460 [Luteolibacter sp.]